MRCRCPSCNAPGILLHERVGWNFTPVSCRACGARFTVPPWTRLSVVALAILTTALAVVLTHALSESAGRLAGLLGFAGAVIAFLAAFTALFAVAPLHKL